MLYQCTELDYQAMSNYLYSHITPTNARWFPVGGYLECLGDGGEKRGNLVNFTIYTYHGIYMYE